MLNISVQNRTFLWDSESEKSLTFLVMVLAVASLPPFHVEIFTSKKWISNWCKLYLITIFIRRTLFYSLRQPHLMSQPHLLRHPYLARQPYLVYHPIYYTDAASCIETASRGFFILWCSFIFISQPITFCFFCFLPFFQSSLVYTASSDLIWIYAPMIRCIILTKEWLIMCFIFSYMILR